MNDLSDIIKNRSTPGVLIFDRDENLLYSNDEVLELLPRLIWVKENGGGDLNEVMAEIHEICRQVIDGSGGACPAPAAYTVIKNELGHDISLRALPIGCFDGERELTHVMIMVDKITEKRNIDFGKARKMFNLSNRETDILRQVCIGLSNKAIAKEMFICEYTVKDHIKNIMKKMNVGSRSEIIALLK